VANILSLGLRWWVDPDQRGHGRRDVDVDEFFDRLGFKTWTCRVEDRFHLGQVRIISMLAEKSRRLKQISDAFTSAGAEFKMVSGPRYDENIAGVFTENVKISLAFLSFLVAVKVRLQQ